MSYEMVCYFASKNMGSKFLNVVDVIWEVLDEIEKEMIVSLLKGRCCTLKIRSKLSQNELDNQIQQTPFIVL